MTETGKRERRRKIQSGEAVPKLQFWNSLKYYNSSMKERGKRPPRHASAKSARGGQLRNQRGDVCP
jgi:hypothetical protein